MLGAINARDDKQRQFAYRAAVADSVSKIGADFGKTVGERPPSVSYLYLTFVPPQIISYRPRLFFSPIDCPSLLSLSSVFLHCFLCSSCLHPSQVSLISPADSCSYFRLLRRVLHRTCLRGIRRRGQLIGLRDSLSLS